MLLPMEGLNSRLLYAVHVCNKAKPNYCNTRSGTTSCLTLPPLRISHFKNKPSYPSAAFLQPPARRTKEAAGEELEYITGDWL